MASENWINASGFIRTDIGTALTIFRSPTTSKIVVDDFQQCLSPVFWRDKNEPFAAVIFNRLTGECLLVRDHFGVEPLFYSQSSGGLIIFGNSFSDLIAADDSPLQSNKAQLRSLFSDVAHYSDETIYSGLLRVEPGHWISIGKDGQCRKTVYWQLQRRGETIRYSDIRDYEAHFSGLLKEAIQRSVAGISNVAAEFSAGMDSMSVFCGAKSLGIEPTLYMHEALPGSQADQLYDRTQEEAFIQRFPDAALIRVGSADFNSIEVLKHYARLFAGPAPYLFFMFADPLHQAVKRGRHSILLSGFGGDQGVSQHAYLRFYLPDLIRRGKLLQAWRQTTGRNPVRRLWKLTSHAHPASYRVASYLEERNRKRTGQPIRKHPYNRKYFAGLRDVEWAFLQGPLSHEVRMRIEYSSLMSRQFGFQYRYPLLYPKLLEFFLSVPAEVKRWDGNGRFLIRRYLAQFFPESVFNAYRKPNGLAILPGTFELFKSEFDQGAFHEERQAIRNSVTEQYGPSDDIRKFIKLYMLNEAITAKFTD